MVKFVGCTVRFVMICVILGFLGGVVCAESVRLSGQVVDEQGKGLKDAYVFLYEIISDQSGLCVARDLTQKTKSDADGNFSFVQDKKPVAGREAVVLAAMEGQCIRWASWDMKTDKEVVLTLGGYGSISGIVKDIEGRPLGNAPVRALLKIASPEPGNRIYCFDRLTKTTDASGRFAFDFIPKDAVAEFYVESAGKISFYGAVRNFSELPFQYKPGDRDVLISVCDESSVSGTVIGPDMKPVAGVELLVLGMISVGPAGQRATTDANGRFHVDHLGSGLYSIYLSHSEVNASWASEPVNVLLGKGEKNEAITLRVTKAGGITFFIQDAQSGVEIPNCSVWLMKEDGGINNAPFSSWRHENEDSLTYKVLAGDYIYKIYAEGYRSYSDNKPIKVQEGESVSITARLESCPQVKGVVRDSKGGIADQARVLIFPGGSRAITNSGGEFQAYFDDERAEGEVWIYCEDSLQQSAAIQPVSKDKPSVSIQLKKTLPLRGRVVNEKGKGVADASIGLYFIDSQNQSHPLRSNCVTDQFGNYSNLGLVPGFRYQIMVYGRSQRAASPVFEAPLGSFSMQLDSITLGITRVAGQVVDEQSNSIGEASVFLYDVIKSEKNDSEFEVKLAGEGVSDSAGQYSIELKGEREGIDHSFVMVSKQDYAIGIELYSPDKQNIKPVVLSSGPKIFSGIIKDSAGNPLSGVSVSVYVSDYQKDYSDYIYYDIVKEAAQTKLLSTTTGQDGVFVIPNIPPYAKGEFVIRAEGYARLYTGKSVIGSEEMTIPVGKAGLAFVLQRLSDVYGVVVDQETGKPIIGEKVFVARIEQGMVAMKAWSSMTGTHALKTEKEDNDELITDGKGYFRSGNLAPGKYRITLDTFSASTRQWSAEPQDIEVGEGQSIEVKVSAVRLGAVTVTVIDSQKQTPVAGAMVYVVPENAESNAVKNTSSTIMPLNTITFVPANGSLEEDGQVLRQLDYGSSKETVIPVKTDNQGKAVFYVAPGTYSVKNVVKKSYEYAVGDERFEVASKGSQEITVKMTALPGICGVCRDSAGQPVASAEIRELGYMEILAVTDGQGWFQFDPAALKQPGSPLVAIQSQLQLGGWGTVVSNKTNALELKPAVLVSGQLAEPAGNSVPNALIHVFSTEQYITSLSQRRPDTKLTPYTEVHTDLFGKFSLLAIPDLSYVIQIAADGYGVVEETIVNIAKSSYRNNKYPDEDYFIDKTIIRGNGPDQTISSRIWRFRSGKDRMDLGLIKLPALDQTLSGIVVDQMGNPLEGYKITIEGKGQPANKTCVSDQSGRFQLDGLCSGLVDVSATNGTYRIFSKWVQVGGTLRLVSADHPVQQAAQADESLGAVDINVIDAETKKQVQGEKLRILITPEQGKDFYLKPDENGEFKTQLPEGYYTIDAINSPLYEGCKIKIEVKAKQSINVELLMKRNPCIEGVVHLPETIRSDEIEIQVEPRISVSVDNYKIAEDGQFTCRLQFAHSLGAQELSYVWFWVRTKDKKYIAVVKHPVKEQNIDITLEPEAIIKIKSKGGHFYACRWEQQEIVKEVGISSSFQGQEDEDGYYVICGLAAKKEGLKYIIGNTKGEIVVDSKELEPGKVKVIEMP